MHEYNECWLYYSFMEQETDPRIKAGWSCTPAAGEPQRGCALQTDKQRAASHLLHHDPHP